MPEQEPTKSAWAWAEALRVGNCGLELELELVHGGERLTTGSGRPAYTAAPSGRRCRWRAGGHRASARRTVRTSTGRPHPGTAEFFSRSQRWTDVEESPSPSEASAHPATTRARARSRGRCRNGPVTSPQRRRIRPAPCLERCSSARTRRGRHDPFTALHACKRARRRAANQLPRPG